MPGIVQVQSPIGSKPIAQAVPVALASDHRSIEVQYTRALYDAFGRLRVSNPVTLFDSKQLYDNQPLVWDDQLLSGSGGYRVRVPALSSPKTSAGTSVLRDSVIW